MHTLTKANDDTQARNRFHERGGDYFPDYKSVCMNRSERLYSFAKRVGKNPESIEGAGFAVLDLSDDDLRLAIRKQENTDTFGKIINYSWDISSAMDRLRLVLGCAALADYTRLGNTLAHHKATIETAIQETEMYRDGSADENTTIPEHIRTNRLGRKSATAALRAMAEGVGKDAGDLVSAMAEKVHARNSPTDIPDLRWEYRLHTNDTNTPEYLVMWLNSYQKELQYACEYLDKCLACLQTKETNTNENRPTMRGEGGFVGVPSIEVDWRVGAFMRLGCCDCDDGSCYRPGSEYGWAPLALGGDPHAFVCYLYLTNENGDRQRAARCWGGVGVDGSVIVSNLYPSCDCRIGAAFTSLMKTAFSKGFDCPEVSDGSFVDSSVYVNGDGFGICENSSYVRCIYLGNDEYSNQSQCADCGDYVHREDMHYIESCDCEVCSCCLYNNYTWADARGDYIPSGDSVWCEHSGTTEHEADCVCLHDGEFCLEDDAVALYDGEYATEDETVELHNGEYALREDENLACDKDGEYFIIDA